MPDQPLPQYREAVESAAHRAIKTYSDISKLSTPIALQRTLELACSSDPAIPQVDGIAQGCVLIVNDHLQWLVGMLQRYRWRMAEIQEKAANE